MGFVLLSLLVFWCFGGVVFKVGIFLFWWEELWEFIWVFEFFELMCVFELLELIWDWFDCDGKWCFVLVKVVGWGWLFVRGDCLRLEVGGVISLLSELFCIVGLFFEGVVLWFGVGEFRVVERLLKELEFFFC